MTAFEGAYDLFVNLSVGLVKILGEKLCLLSCGVAVGGAGAFNDREVKLLGGVFGLFFGNIQKRSYHGYILAGKIGHRLKTTDFSALKQIHEKGFHRVVGVVTEGDFVAARSLCGVVKNSSSHAGAHAAWIALPPDLEYYFIKLSRSDNGLNVKTAAKLDYLRIVGFLAEKARVHHYGFDGEFFWIKTFELAESRQKAKRVLSSRNADGNAVSVVDHSVFVHRLADDA